MTEPMTAAEYRAITKGICDVDPIRRTLAALEEREALLGEREAWEKRLVVAREFANAWEGQAAQAVELNRKLMDELDALKSDASLGALVRRIREHPKNRDRPYPIRPFGCDSVFSIDAAGLAACLSHLDSLLPKEPEVVTGASGRKYRKHGDGKVEVYCHPGSGAPVEWAEVRTLVLADAPTVARLMEGRDNG